MINNITILGRLTEDPELRYTSSGIAYATATIVNEQKYKDKKQINYIDIVAFYGLAENLAKYCEKGRKILVQGKLEIKKNKTQEKTYTNISIMAEYIDFLEKPKSEEGEVKPNEYKNEYTAIKDDEVPF
ncbi:single-stranded DNA-binding protein [Proteocatella sphenisci]|uniref:single-stranded DNA-binding protein n=1 Tax=Proteocatella sphenisci TaxID=181070 RepID=UPI00048F7B86|nr:single-stranded DNA-binding protein [Proteocatella sphenisci]